MTNLSDLKYNFKILRNIWDMIIPDFTHPVRFLVLVPIPMF